MNAVDAPALLDEHRRVLGFVRKGEERSRIANEKRNLAQGCGGTLTEVLDRDFLRSVGGDDAPD